MTINLTSSSADLASAYTWSLITLHRDEAVTEIIAGDSMVLLGVDESTLKKEGFSGSAVGQRPSPCPWIEPCESSIYLILFDSERTRWVESKSRRLESGALLVSTRTLPGQGRESVGFASQARLSFAGSLLGPLAHELNNIVQGLTSAEYLIRDSMECGEEVEMEDVDQITLTLNALKELGASVQNFSRNGSMEREHFALAPLVNRAVGILRSTGLLKTTDLSMDLAPELPDIYWCRADFEFILQALLANAAEAAQNSDLQSHRVSLAISCLANTLSIRVCNTEGEFDLADMVKPFRSSQPGYRHAGIGLSAVSELLARCQGRMTQIEEGGLPGLLIEIPLDATTVEFAE